MSRSPLVRLLGVISTLAVLPADGARAQTPADVRRVAQDVTLERAREGAMRKLAQSECLRLLRDFADGDGRPLVESLATWDRSAADYVRTMPFRDGSFHALCRSGKSALVSVVGMRPVFVCPSFRKLAARDPWAAENWVIHEMLHTLGLGENPPSSREITRRVGERCQ